MIRHLFSLPVQIKQKNMNPKPYHGYFGQYASIPLFESFGLEDASNYDSLRNFTELMWPNDYRIHMIKQLDELKDMIELMILDSYGLAEKLNSIMVCKTLLQIMKYSSPPSGEYMQGIHAHNDKVLSTIICDDQVSGLEFQTKDGQWIKFSLSPNSFVFIVGDPLLAWSNGRMHPVNHRVKMCGENERYSLGIRSICSSSRRYHHQGTKRVGR
ncbi:putative oxoglutarate/iron-dependent dioxygenase, isopenicillin N synthase [Rosa chinensis]|uniref:Putative oxoglutarate/iron-dependent dioxygenase, isopenicillin N synthase n=1 Tax=Rosa chinensis TaxID=74649 RepID=A0A2P6QDA7_ROSCH|nr:putative oxoglutarate/iron-dependent dioxygenase, isopenicillin N synthase [Rosa chinensis]